MKANRYPCPDDDCDGVVREAPSIGHGTELECSKCDAVDYMSDREVGGSGRTITSPECKRDGCDRDACVAHRPYCSKQCWRLDH